MTSLRDFHYGGWARFSLDSPHIVFTERDDGYQLIRCFYCGDWFCWESR
jgi:hypothetical protein